MGISIKEDFTATGTSAEQFARSGGFVISGTFVGTIELQRRINNVWQAIAIYTGPTTVIDATSFDNGSVLPMRFEVTDYTSGTIEAALA